MDLNLLAEEIRAWAKDLGFDEIGITDTDLSLVSDDFRDWLSQGFNGDMTYMKRNIDKRMHPHSLMPGTVRVISARMNYLPMADRRAIADPSLAYISRYALGRDYHKLMRRRLAKLAKKIVAAAGGKHRAFVDSAPVLEKPLAQKALLGWVGKNTLLLHPDVGSFFFLGEIYTDLPLPVSKSEEIEDQCGSCKACMAICPTDALIDERKIDATKCVSYLTIEHKGSIPIELRPLVGNRIFGCDDCQIVCPWNRFAPRTTEQDFQPRHGLDEISIVELLTWDETTFLKKTEGSALRRVNFRQWTRNVAVAAGNAPSCPELIDALRQKREEMKQCQDEMCLEHLDWALSQHLDDSRLQQIVPDKSEVRQSTP